MSYFLRCTLAIVIVSFLAGAAGSLIQTQVNLNTIASMNAPVTVIARILVSMEDLARFGLIMSAIAAGALTPAFLVSHLLMRAFPIRLRKTLFSVSGFTGFWVIFWVMSYVTPMPNLIVATEQIPGRIAMCLTGLAGGVVYAFLTKPTNGTSVFQRPLLRIAYTVIPMGGLSVLTFLILAPKASDSTSIVNPASYMVQSIAGGLNYPWSLAFLPDGRSLVTERAGRLLLIEGDGLISQISMHGLTDSHTDRSAGRFMDVLVDPDFALNNYLYFTMVYESDGLVGTRLVRAKLVQNHLEQFRTLFSGSLKPNDGNNGGALAFLPDRTILLTTGDGDLRREAQNPLSSLGKIVRVSADDDTPSNSPYFDQHSVLPLIFSMGHRNPQGITVSRESKEILAVEHGPRGGDEVNIVVAGGNYGWPIVSGGVDYSFARISPFFSSEHYQAPLVEWTPSIAPSRIAIYEEKLFPEWYGDVFVATLKERSVRRIIRNNGLVVRQELLLTELGKRIRDIKVGNDGALYFLTDGENADLLRIVPATGD